MIELKVASRWRSLVCGTEAVIVRTPKVPGVLSCGGQPMIKAGDPVPEGLTLSGDSGQGSLVGKRYTDAESGLEALCVKAGVGALAFDGRSLTIRQAKKLPSSD